MKKRYTLFLFLPLLLWGLLFGCSGGGEEAPWQIYYPTQSYFEGATLASEGFDPAEEPTVEDLMARLLSGPESEGLVSPFPRGTSLRSFYLKDSVAYINLSEAYGGLAGIHLTLADYAITLTLCQLPEVEGVSITVENDPIPFRYRQILTAADVLLEEQEPAAVEP